MLKNNLATVQRCRCDVIARVVYVFGGRVKHPVNDITPTFLTDRVLAKLRSADSAANKILQDSGKPTVGHLKTYEMRKSFLLLFTLVTHVSVIVML